jgi:hypothetical protein
VYQVISCVTSKLKLQLEIVSSERHCCTPVITILDGGYEFEQGSFENLKLIRGAGVEVINLSFLFSELLDRGGGVACHLGVSNEFWRN